MIYSTGLSPVSYTHLDVYKRQGAYVSEIIRAGIESIDRGQFEAGQSLGLSQGTIMKSIILPQAIKNILPALGNEFITPVSYTHLDVYKRQTIHIPVILGSILLGWKSGAVLGGLFGLTSFMVNTITPNLTSFVFTPFYSLGDAHGKDVYKRQEYAGILYHDLQD